MAQNSIIDLKDLQELNNIFENTNGSIDDLQNIKNNIETNSIDIDINNTLDSKIASSADNNINSIVNSTDTLDKRVDNTLNTNIKIISNSINNFENISENINNKINNVNTEVYGNANTDNNIEEIPYITFTNSNINEIKSFDTNNFLSKNSITSNSEFSYTNNVKKHNFINNLNNSIHIPKFIKQIKSNTSKKIYNEIDETDYIYNKLQDYVRYMKIDRKNYVILICKAVEFIENYKEININNDNNINNGKKNKKDIITKSLIRLISIDLDLNEFDKKLFVLSISNLIDLIVNFTKKKKHDNQETQDKNDNQDKHEKYDLYDKYEKYENYDYYNNHSHNYNDNHKNNIKMLKDNSIDNIILANAGQIIHSLIDKLTTIVIKKQYCIEKIFVNIATLTTILMILVDKYIYLSGVEKKIIVLQAINDFIEERLQYIIEFTDHKKQELILSLDSIPLIVDLFISLQKGKYKINKISKKDDINETSKKSKVLGFFNKKKNKNKNDDDNISNIV